jgi:hypothetical protein
MSHVISLPGSINRRGLLPGSAGLLTAGSDFTNTVDVVLQPAARFFSLAPLSRLATADPIRSTARASAASDAA